jgi:predicted SprT family Zn-dependent metalloprotease
VDFVVESLLAELRAHFSTVNACKFSGVLPRTSLVVNRRLRALTGRVFYDEKLIELSHYHLVQPYGRDQAFKTLEHEMLHLYLDTIGQSPGHTPTFKRLARDLEISVWHGLPYPKNRVPTVLHMYECPVCGKRISRNRRLSEIRRNACGDCCRVHNKGGFDVRFLMRYVRTIIEDVTPPMLPTCDTQRHLSTVAMC